MRLLFLTVLIAASLRADIYEVVRETSRDRSVVTTYKYGRQGSVRLWQTGNFWKRYIRYIVIWNEERGVAYELDPDTHEYVEPWQGDWIVLLAHWIARPRVHQSGKTVDIYYETIDTGQRRQILGHTARHLQFRERHVAAPGACNSSFLKEDDGWYIAFPERDPGWLGTIGAKLAFGHYDSNENYGCHDTVVKHDEPPYPGLLVFQEKKGFTLEVIALSSAPLAKNLFEVPGNYKKVDRFNNGEGNPSWNDKLSLDWHRLVESIATWF